MRVGHLRVGLGESHSAKREQNNAQYKTKGFHCFILLKKFISSLALGPGLFAGVDQLK
jgi:hypothetical protein